MRKIKFKAWLKKAKKSKSLIFLSALGILILVVFLVSPLHSAASTFRANWDSGSLNADYAIGSKTAQNDGTPAEIVNPGYGGAGGAVKASAGQTLKYELADSLDKEKGEIEMKFKLPYDLGGDHSTGKVNRPNGVDYDSSSGYIYIADSENNRIVKTKIDGTGWTTFGSEGSGAGEFSRPVGIHYDSALTIFIFWIITITGLSKLKWMALAGQLMEVLVREQDSLTCITKEVAFITILLLTIFMLQITITTVLSKPKSMAPAGLPMAAMGVELGNLHI